MHTRGKPEKTTDSIYDLNDRSQFSSVLSVSCPVPSAAHTSSHVILLLPCRVKEPAKFTSGRRPSWGSSPDPTLSHGHACALNISPTHGGGE